MKNANQVSKTIPMLIVYLMAQTALAGGSPSRLEGQSRELPMAGASSTRITDSYTLISLFQNSYDQLQDPACFQKMMNLPGHLARAGAGYHISGVSMNVSQPSCAGHFLCTESPTLYVDIGYSAMAGIDEHPYQVSNGYPDVVQTCALK